MISGLQRFRSFAGCALALGGTPSEQWNILWRLSKNLRVRLGLARYHPERVDEVPTRYGRLFLRDNFGDVTNLPDLFYHCVYRARRVTEGGAILDVGANIGLFAAWAAYHNPDKPIYCFEPLAANVRLVAMNCPRATVTQVALGRHRTSMTLRVDRHDIMASSIATAWPTREEAVTVMPLDVLAREQRVGTVAFLKIDTEGMELDVLDGASETLRRTQRVAMETHSPELHRQSIGRLREAGFAVEGEEFADSTGLVFAARHGG